MSAPSGSATVSHSVLYPSVSDYHPSILDDALGGTFGNYHMYHKYMFTDDPSDSTSRKTSVPAGIGRHGPLPQGGKSGRGRGCSRGGRRGKRVVKSAKRCRRKAKRSRKAHS